MFDHQIHDISFDEFDELNNPRLEETDFDKVVEAVISRRRFLGGVLVTGTSAFLVGTASLTASQVAVADRFGFEPVSANSLDTITVPKGFNWQIFIRWGDPLWSNGIDFNQTTRGTAESQELAFGDNNDGMSIFTQGDKFVMAVNNEYTNRPIMYGARNSRLPENLDDILKGKAAHGISIFEIEQVGGKWKVVKDSQFNRRITADTPMQLTGPAAGHALLKTKDDPSGQKSLGTWNNCGSGRTPWGTYLACEENFNGYFSSSDSGYDISEELQRYGIKHKDWGYAWSKYDERFDISKNPNEPNRAGYIVEIDPLNPNLTPKKRTALGRLKHENAEVVVASDGRVVIYMGDDERGEFIYRFVSDGTYSAAAGSTELLNNGRLYAAKFDPDGRGEWLELSPQSTGMASQAEICIHTRIAGSAVKATTMDRPEWVTSHPNKAEVYCALTNNKNRGKKPNKGGDPTPVGGPNPREANKYGQIVRWRPDNSDHTARGFEWDLYVLAGNPLVHKDPASMKSGSKNITPGNFFNSPDGIAFDSNGMLWIQTDGKYSNTGDFQGMGNNQMLVGDPQTGEIRRFLVGPRECEVTGLAFSPDRRTLFVGIQHPGEKGDSHFPDGNDSVPRSSVAAITRDDGGVIG